MDDSDYENIKDHLKVIMFLVDGLVPYMGDQEEKGLHVVAQLLNNCAEIARDGLRKTMQNKEK
jgi:hypothetical protein